MGSGGSKANKSGSNLEWIVESMINKYNYKEFDIKNKNAFVHCRDLLGGKWYVKQAYIGKTIYDTPRYCDFITFNENKHNTELLAIECKWQETSGSVDEKYPYLVYNISISRINTIIILDGDGYREGAKKWLYNMVDEIMYLKAVYSIKEFKKLVNSNSLL